MERQQESMWVTRFLFSLLSSHDGARSQILGAKEHPSHGEFQSFRQVTLPSSIPSPTDRSALAASIDPSCPSRPYRPPGFGRSQPEPISSDIAAMERQQESMWVTRFLFSLLSSHDGARSQILGAKEHPSHGEFQSFRQVTLPSSIPSPTDRSALAASIDPSCPSRPYRPPGFGRSQPNRPSHDYPHDGRSFGRGARDRGVAVIADMVLSFALIATRTIIL
ncbi:hypothetical protein Acr_00g0037300 [Actinidia rufa]|uniref:Uncharacterized protein n=1 Tax=Actinidia rufa TaxID=165716 RepID=A0A7J0DH03_9ERIC|nr:hypothetical protein Acr_00g0037300 [Actinidia rufa]